MAMAWNNKASLLFVCADRNGFGLKVCFFHEKLERLFKDKTYSISIMQELFSNPFGLLAMFFQLIVLFWGLSDQIYRLKKATVQERKKVSLPFFGFTLLACLTWALHSSLEIWNPYIFFVQIPGLILGSIIVVLLVKK